MALKKIVICAAALVAAMATSQLVQAAGKGSPNKGVSANSPGHQPVPSGSDDPGKSGNAPGDIKHDTGAANAKELAPGDQRSKKK